MIKNVIFDIGGVILGRDFDRFGELVAGSFAFFGSGSFPQFWKDFDRGLLTKQQVAQQMAAMNGTTSAQCMADIDRAQELLSEIPETVTLVEELKAAGYKLYVLSNMPVEFWQKMQTMRVFGFFDGIVISSAEHLCKPETEFFELLFDRYRIDPEESLFVDDRLFNTQKAEAMGMQSVLYTVADGADKVKRKLEMEP